MPIKPLIIIVTQEECIGLVQQMYILQLCPYLNRSLRELLADIYDKGHGACIRCSISVQQLARSESLRVPTTQFINTTYIPPRSTVFVIDPHAGMTQTKHIVVKEKP